MTIDEVLAVVERSVRRLRELAGEDCLSPMEDAEPCPRERCPMCQPELVKAGTCRLPNPGWFCTLDRGHDGPCPTWPIHHLA